MNTKKLVFAWLAGFVAMFLLSGLWYMVLMPDYYGTQFADVSRAEPLFTWIVFGYLVGSFLLAYIYPIGYKGESPLKEGLRFGFFMGLLLAVPSMFIGYAVNTYPLSGTMVDIIYQIVEKTIGGGVIGYVYGGGAESE